MSWFDQLFGEDDKDQSSQRSKRRRKGEQEQKQKETTFVQQSHDIYQRPRGKFRFPIEMHDEAAEHAQQTDAHQDNHVSTHDDSHDRRPSFTVDRQHRRHRGVQQAHYYDQQESRDSNSDTRTSHQNGYAFVAQSSQRPKKQKRNSDDFVAQPHYHQKPFQASEVPSAIFGTKQPKKIENSGLNQPPGARKALPQSESTNHSTKQSSTETQTTSTSHNQTTERTEKSKPQARRRNTISLDNFYASQIVEEIRREREKKMLQKKNFKEALKKKRESYEQHANPDIQKAIDEMYSAQARQLLGEKYDDTADEAIINEDFAEETVDSTTEEAEEVTSIEPIYEYEEVDLSQLDKENSDDLNQTSEPVTFDEPLDIETMLVDDAGESTEEDMMQHHDSADEHVATTSSPMTEVETDVDEADTAFEEIEMASDVLNESQDDEVVDESFDNMDESDSVVEVVEDDEPVSQPVQQTGSMPTLEPELKPESSQSQKPPEVLNEKVEAQQGEEEKTSQPTVNQESPQQPPSKPNKVPIRKGSKPFNVVMTPSDKKRMMSRQQKAKAESTNGTEQATPIESSVRAVPPVQVEQQVPETATEHVHRDSERESSQPPAPTQEVKTIRRGPNLKLPSLDLLEAPEEHEQDENWIAEKKEELNNAFYYFNVPAEVVNVVEGPSVTRFELSVERGVKVSRITALQDDIKMALAAKDIRIEAPIPGTSLVGIEVPNPQTTKVNISSILNSPKFKNAESKLTVAMGNRINNEPLLMDIAKTPHALIAGATGSGKSVSINSILISLLYRNHPEELRLLLIDPKMVELAPYNGLPHLVAPVITDVKAATQSLKWAVDEMERRFKLFAHHHVRNISAFNKKVNYDQRIPKIVIVIDELADLMMMAPQDVEQSIARLAQKARACGIHMLVATQRPSVNVITGLIKANIPTRIAFMVSSSVDSRTILDSGGAERLLGYGDMLYLGSGMNKPIRVQGTFVSDEEIDQVVEFIRAQREPEYLFQEKELLEKNEAPSRDELFDEVCQFMVREQHISTSLIQRHFQIGYNRAARIIDQLEQLGYISGANGSKPRDVYLTESELSEL
ncbi:DNA translocase FtsK [Staphylococcus cornubiensis]|uniref:DNA translocase FtsK n=1 Tax=Staphylococcus cornubiensis TaxID=1986155 RepID=UPI000A3BF7E7|nr:DNA translocase FtsK [Staphylococcus cornubiensis]